MELKRNAQPSVRGPAEYFTGTVRIDQLFKAPAPSRAIQEELDGRGVDWLEKVTDNQYNASREEA
jgi:hypothetical protein